MTSRRQNDPFVKSISSATFTTPFHTIFAIKSLSSSGSMLFDLSLLTVEYLQLVSSILVFTLSLKGKTESSLPQGLEYLAKIINPSFWISMENLGNSEIIILSFLMAFVVFRYAIFGFLVYVAKCQKRGYLTIERIWKMIFKIQSRFLYYFLTTYLINIVLQINNDGGEITIRTQNKGFSVISILIIILEYAFSLYLNLRYCYMLPTKSFLSSKNNFLETTTLTQKFLLQVFIIALVENSNQYLWVFPILNLLFDVIRIISLFRTLPLYKLSTLSYQTSLQAGLLALNIACLTTVIAKTADDSQKNMILFSVVWFALSVLLINSAREYLQKTLWSLISNPDIKFVDLLIHRVFIIKTFSKSPLKSGEQETSWMNLALRSLTQNLDSVLKVNSDLIKEDINSKETRNQLIKIYLESLFNKYPKDKFISLFIAYFYAKKLKLYGEATRILKDLKANSNAAILLIEIQDLLNIKENYNNKGCEINLTEYNTSQALFTQLKSEILHQAKLQIIISSEILKEAPDLGLISQESQKFNKYRSRVLKKLKHIFHVIPDYFIEPFILAAGYFLTLNHSITDFEQFSKLYSQKFHKYEKFFAQDKIANENLYQDNVGCFVLSGHGEDAGKIVYTNTRSTKFFGGTPESLAGTHISGRAPPCLRGIYSAYYKLLTQRDANLQTFFLDTIIEGFNYHHDGYMILTNYYMNIHPVLTHGLYLLALQRSVPNSKDYMYMLENGDIDCVTKEFGTKLGLIPCYKDSSNKPLFNVSRISHELEIANEAFNMIALPEKFPPKNLNIEEAREIYEMYTTTGCDLDFNVYDEKNGSYLMFSYHCKIKGGDSGIPTLKLLTLQENKMESQAGSKENSIASPLEELEKSKSHNFEIESEDMEEKKQGWIDFEPLTSRVNTLLTTQRGLLSSSPKETAVSLVQNSQIEDHHPSNPRLFKRKMTKKLLNVVRVLNLEKKIKHQQKTQEEEDPEDGDFQSRISVNTSYNSKGTRQRKVCKLFQSALDLFYVPKTFYILLISFYIALIIVLVCRSIIKVVLDDIIADMKVKKDILTNAQFRNYTLISIQSIIRSFWDVNTGAVDFSSLGIVAVLVGAFEQFVTSSLTFLANTNQDLLQSATSLNKDTQDFLFQKDVKIYETYFDAPVQIFSSLNTFQATDRVIEKGLDLVHFGGAVTPESIDNSNFIFRNTLNDLVVKNEGTSDLILDSLVPQRSNFIAIIRNYLIGVILFIILITVAFGIVSWKQYKKEKYYLTSCCRLNQERTRKVLDKFKHFVEIIESQVPLNSSSFEISSSISPVKRVKVEPNDHNKEFTMKSPKTEGIKRFYIIAIIKMIVLMIVIIGANIFISIFNLTFLSRFRVKQDQLYFANRIESRVSLTVATYRELLRTNNLAHVENRPALTELTKLIEELSTLKNDAFDELLVGDSQENSDLSSVLIGDPCSILSSSLYTYICESLKTQGKKTGMIYLINSLQSLLTNKIQQYQDSNKTTESLKSILEEDFAIISSVYIVINADSELISSIISKNFSLLFKKTASQRVLALTLLYTTIGIVGILLWILIFHEMRKSVYKFKNVLKVFPPDLVLSSFVLKFFLMKTSKGILDTIRNDS